MKIKALVLAITVTIAINNYALAQETASALRGVVTTEAGTVVSQASIRLTDLRNGTSRTLLTNNSGTFAARGLQVGGPYQMFVTSPEGLTKTIDNVFLTLGDTQNLNVVLPQVNIERIAVSGNTITNANYGSKSPVANFSLKDLQTIPAINRDLSDVVAADPRIYVDAGYARGIQCNGSSPRFNSLTVDGVRMNDNFGLNDNGYPTERMPFSYDAIQQVAVEFAPYDVKYGRFTACNINAVTKSGTNELTGSFFYDYTNDSFKGDKLEGTQLTSDNFTEKRYGLNLGGALVEDKLFWFAAYEKYQGVDTFSRGPQDSNTGTPVAGLNQADLDRIAQIAFNRYGYQVGQPIATSPVEDEKLLIKLDWYINDNHRAAFTYNHNDGGSVKESDGASYNYEFSDHYYNRSARFDSYVFQLYSDWSDNLSTEIRAGYSELDNNQENIGPGGMAEVQVTVNNGARATVLLGVDDSRQSNKLAYDTSFFKLAATYSLDDHVFYAGYEFEQYNVFNMFLQHSIGEYHFASIDDFAAGMPAHIYYGNAAATLNPDNAAANFGYAMHTLYAQDEYYLYDLDMTITYGLRYDFYRSSDKPRLNQSFINRYGFANNTTFDGEALLQPRIGINWNLTNQIELRAGLGLYSGGNPNVWLANGYQSDGITQVQVEDNTRPNLFNIPLSGSGRPLFDAPQAMVDQVIHASGDSAVNAVDPNFKLPQEWKYSIGATYTFDDGTVVLADVLYSIAKNQAIIKDIAVEPTGTMFDGRPIYAAKEGSRKSDFLLSNATADSKKLSFSTSVNKNFALGLNLSLAYAYTRSEDANPMMSSVAYSNFNYFARSDFNNPSNATSNYEIPHRFTFSASYDVAIFDGYATTVSLLGSHNKGRPYSYTFENNIAGDYVAGRQLLYVPTGVNDNNVVFAPSFDTEAFFKFVKDSGLDKYSGRILERNAFSSDWWTKVDLRLSQELPGFIKGHKSKVFVVVDNFTNLLNDDWGVLKEAKFPQLAAVVDATVNGQGQYVFNDFTQREPQARVESASLWRMTIGIEYKF